MLCGILLMALQRERACFIRPTVREHETTRRRWAQSGGRGGGQVRSMGAHGCFAEMANYLITLSACRTFCVCGGSRAIRPYHLAVSLRFVVDEKHIHYILLCVRMRIYILYTYRCDCDGGRSECDDGNAVFVMWRWVYNDVCGCVDC